MPYKQVREILEQVLAHHERLRAWYESLADEARDERVQALLEHTSEHEERVRDLLEPDSGASEAALDTWVQFDVTEEARRAFDTSDLDPAAEPETVIREALEIDQGLLEAYKRLRGATSAQRVRELFDNLVELEETRERGYAWTLADLRP